MRIDAVSRSTVMPLNRTYGKNVSKTTGNGFSPKVISFSEYFASPLSFTGRNKGQAIFVGAEVAPYSKAGGVGVVMKDYGTLLPPKDSMIISPYYRANVNDDTDEVTPCKDKDGDYVLKTDSGDIKLDLVATRDMQWGLEEHNKIMLFSQKGDKDKVHYFVFMDDTAAMQKPYQPHKKDGDSNPAPMTYRSGAFSNTNAWKGDIYAKFDKAICALMPDAIADKPDFNPATVVCSDSQTAYVIEYMAQDVAKNGESSKLAEIKPTYVAHNMGPGYCGETSKQNMFVNLGATPDQISAIEKDPLFKEGRMGDDYFKPFVEKTIDETGTASAIMIPIHYANKERANNEGFVKGFTTVAEEYASNLATNPQAAHNIYNHLKELYEQGTFSGILNPLEDASIDAAKNLPNELYNCSCRDTDGTFYSAFEKYPENPTYEQMRNVKNGNKAKLLERLSAEDTTIVTGNKKRTARINPEAKDVYDGPAIRPELIKMIRSGKGDQVPVFVSWGRIDTQKGHDITLSAFEKFAKTKEGRNAILILGAGFEEGAPESKIVYDKMQEMLQDPDLQGRVVHIDGWAPAYAMASAADAAIFSSRFEPCGLTDLEAMKYYCTPIVTNTQGFKQKNFDPRNPNEADKATSYKTKHEFNLTKDTINLIVNSVRKNTPEAKEALKKEFPSLVTKTKNGKEVFDRDGILKKFAEEYEKDYAIRKSYEEAIAGEDGEIPPKALDWDEWSKDYNFKNWGYARELKDSILACELSDAISACTTQKPETKEQIFKNIAALQTGWKENGNLHPDGKSSYQAYKDVHLDPDYSYTTKDDLIGTDDKFVKSTIESRQKEDILGRVAAYTIGSLTGVAGALFARTKNIEYKSKEDELAKKIKVLEEQIAETAKANKRNLVIVGACAAVGAGLITFLAARNLYKSKEPKQQEAFVAPNPSVTAQQTVETPSLTQSVGNLNLNDFKNNLNAVA